MNFIPQLNTNFVIKSLSGEQNIKSRLIELGFVAGHIFKITQQLSFGEPFIIEVQGTSVALRTKELECIQVQN